MKKQKKDQALNKAWHRLLQERQLLNKMGNSVSLDKSNTISWSNFITEYPIWQWCFSRRYMPNGQENY